MVMVVVRVVRVVTFLTRSFGSAISFASYRGYVNPSVRLLFHSIKFFVFSRERSARSGLDGRAAGQWSDESSHIEVLVLDQLY